MSMAGRKSLVRIGGASGYWGDTSLSTPQLLSVEGLDYLAYDYLAEVTMSVLARARAKDDKAGFAQDFVSDVLANNLADIAQRGVKVLSNAGGVNVLACVQAVRALVKRLGLGLRVAAIVGDDLFEQRKQLAAAGIAEMFSGTPFPDAERLVSINAYLGAFPIAKALAEGADIVITGRSVDSAVTLGACIHEFGWSPADWNELAGGTLAGHIIECGAQATGGNHTDWEAVPRIDEIGYPIAEVSHDGSFICTKPAGTGGLVSVGTVAEQMLYEIGDPQAYLMPDVVCDFSQVRIEQAGEDRVRVSGALGRAAPSSLKVSATYEDGFRGGRTTNFYGPRSDLKGLRYAEALLARARSVLRKRNLADFSETSVEIIGAESQYGAAREISFAREVAVKTAVRHPEKAGIDVFLREANGIGLASPPGASGFQGGRPAASPVVRLFSFLIPKDAIAIVIDLDGEVQTFETSMTERPRVDPVRPQVEDAADFTDAVCVPLMALAFGRSGDKGDKANIGLIAREASYLPFIRRSLTVDIIAERFSHFLKGAVERFDLPGCHGLNFLLHDVLGGGGVGSLRSDAQGKGFAQLLMDFPIEVPREMAVRRALDLVSEQEARA
jgi:hypothetical protein